MSRKNPLPPSLSTRSFSISEAKDNNVSLSRLRAADLSIPFRGVRTVNQVGTPIGSGAGVKASMTRSATLAAGLGPVPAAATSGMTGTATATATAISTATSTATSTESATQQILQRVEAFLPLLRPWQALSHTTAAVLWGFPLPQSSLHARQGHRYGHAHGHEHELGQGHEHAHGQGRGHRSVQLHVTVAAPRLPPQREGIVAHRSRNPVATVMIDSGIHLTDPAATWFGLASLPRTQLSSDDLIAAGDFMVRQPEFQRGPWHRPLIGLDQLHARLKDFTGPGKKRAELALRLVREGSDSRPETLLRLLLLRAGLPEPVLNPVIRDRNGARIGRVDLAYPGYKVIVEYDGDQHRTTTTQYEHDMTRASRLQREDWLLVRIRKHGLFVEPQNTVDQVRTALRERGWRPVAARRSR